MTVQFRLLLRVLWCMWRLVELGLFRESTAHPEISWPFSFGAAKGDATMLTSTRRAPDELCLECVTNSLVIRDQLFAIRDVTCALDAAQRLDRLVHSQTHLYVKRSGLLFHDYSASCACCS
jgi:hypothetical protein